MARPFFSEPAEKTAMSPLSTGGSRIGSRWCRTLTAWSGKHVTLSCIKVYCDWPGGQGERTAGLYRNAATTYATHVCFVSRFKCVRSDVTRNVTCPFRAIRLQTGATRTQWTQFVCDMKERPVYSLLPIALHPQHCVAPASLEPSERRADQMLEAIDRIGGGGRAINVVIQRQAVSSNGWRKAR